jgi:hypothetical protein
MGQFYQHQKTASFGTAVIVADVHLYMPKQN